VNIYQKMAVILGLSLFLPLAWQIVTGKVTQNLATFLLWGAQDAILASALYTQNGNWQLAAAYMCGSVLIIMCILKSRVFEWTDFETYMSVLVLSCLVMWKINGPSWATVMTSLGMFFGGLSQVKDSWKDPSKSPLKTYVGYTIANILSVIGGKSWAIEERFYPMCCTILCAMIVVASLRKTKTAIVS